MIRRLRARNYRSLAEVDLALEPITVFVGPNGSGKSNLIDALRFTHEAVVDGLETAVRARNGMPFVRRATALDPAPLLLEVEWADGRAQGSYGFALDTELQLVGRLRSEVCRFSSEEGGDAGFAIIDRAWDQAPKGFAPAIPENALVLPLLAGVAPFDQIYRQFAAMSFYNIFPPDLASPQLKLNAYPLGAHAENLASVLASLEPASRRALEASLHWATGDVTGYRVEELGGYLLTQLKHEWNTNGGKTESFFLSEESDGTLRLLAILTALVQQPPRALIAIEEPELTVHPAALRVVWEKMVEVSAHTQLLITTHSPDLLDLCSAEQLRVVEKVDGDTRIGPVAEEQRAMIRKRLVAPGQLLQAQGLRRAEAE